MGKTLLLSIIVSTKDRPDALKGLIASIESNTNDFEIIIHDDSVGESIPVATAWNKCAAKAKGDFLVFLNDDMLVTTGWADSMMEFWNSHPICGSLAFKVYDDLGRIQSRGHSFLGTAPYLPDEDVIEVDYSDHPFMTKTNWERVGGFTAHGQLYYEDADMGLKLQSVGLKNYYNPNAVLYHQTIGLRVGTERDKEKRLYNENIVQQKSKVSFFKSWTTYLNEKKNK